MAKPKQRDFVRENKALHSEKYTLNQSIGDMIDNSIDAKASEINIILRDCDYAAANSPKKVGVQRRTYKKGLPYLHGTHSYLLIQDNGNGMSENELYHALTMGADRDYKDYELGHFGVGMKKSTLSQAFELTILSKNKGKVSLFRMSSIHSQENPLLDELLEISDIKTKYAWMMNTVGWRDAQERISELDNGTILLLEGMHKIEDEFGTLDEREEYLESIQEKIIAYIGLTFQRYLESGHEIKRTNKQRPKKIKPITITVNFAKVHPLDPFFSKVTSTTTNHMTLKRSLSAKTVIDGSEHPLDAISYILPQAANLYANPIAKSIEKSLLKINGSRMVLQGIYIYRHQRLIDYSGNRPWRGVGPESLTSTTAAGRWEVHLPPHEALDLDNLDFGLDSTKTDVPLGQKTKESLKKFWAGSHRQWHKLDTDKATYTGRLKHRTHTKEGFEVICGDCGILGHPKNSKKCPKYTPSIPGGGTTTSGGTTGGGTKTSGGTTSGETTGGGTTGGDPTGGGSGSGNGTTGKYSIKTVNTGNLIEEKSGTINVNEKHSAFGAIKNWFKKQ